MGPRHLGSDHTHLGSRWQEGQGGLVLQPHTTAGEVPVLPVVPVSPLHTHQGLRHSGQSQCSARHAQAAWIVEEGGMFVMAVAMVLEPGTCDSEQLRAGCLGSLLAQRGGEGLVDWSRGGWEPGWLGSPASFQGA